jgi:toxin ParE1/3/4
MRIRWFRDAILDLIELRQYIGDDNPHAAQEVAGQIIHDVEHLRDHPAMGRPGRVEGTRELVISRFPYIFPIPREEQRHRGASRVARSKEAAGEVVIAFSNTGSTAADIPVTTLLPPAPVEEPFKRSSHPDIMGEGSIHARTRKNSIGTHLIFFLIFILFCNIPSMPGIARVCERDKNGTGWFLKKKGRG